MSRFLYTCTYASETHPLDDVGDLRAVVVLGHCVEEFLVDVGEVAVDAADDSTLDRLMALS